MPIYKSTGKRDGLQKYNVRVNYMSDSGKPKQLTRTVYGLDAAKEMERRLEHDFKVKDETPIKKMTVKQLFDEYIKFKQYEVRETTLDKTTRILRCHILPMLADISIEKLSAKILQEWKISLEEQGLGLKTKKNIFGELRTMLNYAIRMEYLSKNPLKKVGNFKGELAAKQEISFYTPEEFRKFINVAKQKAMEKQAKNHDLFEWHYYVFFCIAFYTGLRKGEIHALRWNDISNGYLSVKRSITQKLHHKDIETPPKNKSSIRTLQLPKPLIDILDEHKKRQQQLADFTDDSRILGDRLSLRDTSIQNRNILYASLAGVKRIRIHDFRHSHASLLANMGINIQEIARRLGHAKIEMTWNTYSHLYPKEEEKAMAVLNAV